MEVEGKGRCVWRKQGARRKTEDGDDGESENGSIDKSQIGPGPGLLLSAPTLSVGFDSLPARPARSLLISPWPGMTDGVTQRSSNVRGATGNGSSQHAGWGMDVRCCVCL